MAVHFGGRTITVAGTVQTNPTSGTVLVDGGAIDETGFYEVRVIASADASSQLRLEYRNAANNATTTSYPFYVGQNAPCEFILRLPIPTVNERFRVAMDATQSAGHVVAHININRIG